MRTGSVVVWMLFCSITSATAQVSVGIGLPGVSIGINLPAYPQLVAGAGLPRLLRSAGEFELLLLRRHVLGLPGRQLVRELLVQRAVGARVARSRCRCSSCASPCATTGSHPRTFAAGARMRRRAGASIGATLGAAATADGTVGIATPSRAALRCPCISGSIQGTAIRRRSSSRHCKARTTATSRTKP